MWSSDLSLMTMNLYSRLVDLGFEVPDDFRVDERYNDMASIEVKYVVVAGDRKEVISVLGCSAIPAEQVAERLGLTKKVVHLPPPQGDIVGGLRWIANLIESGQVSADSVYCVGVMPDKLEPWFYAYGREGLRHEIAGVFMHVAQLALTDKPA